MTTHDHQRGVQPAGRGDGDGVLTSEDGRAIVTFVRRLAQPPAKVWRALTDPEALADWFPTTIEGELVPGAPLRFAHRDLALPAMTGQLVAFDPPRLMELWWGEDLLRFELEPRGEGTLLTLVATMAEFGKAARDGAGWHVCLDGLDAVLTGGRPLSRADDRWRVVHPGYVERFGAAAATLGPPQEWVEAQGDRRQ